MKEINYTQRQEDKILDYDTLDDLYYMIKDEPFYDQYQNFERETRYGLGSAKKLDNYCNLVDEQDFDKDTSKDLKLYAEDLYFSTNNGNNTNTTIYELDKKQFKNENIDKTLDSFADLKTEEGLQKSLEMVSRNDKDIIELYNPHYDLQVQKYDGDMILSSSDRRTADVLNQYTNESVAVNDIDISNIKEVRSVVTEDALTPKNRFKANGLDIVDFYEENKDLPNKEFIDKTIDEMSTFKNDRVENYVLHDLAEKVDAKKELIKESDSNMSENDLDLEAFKKVNSELSNSGKSSRFESIARNQISMDLKYNDKSFEEVKDFVKSNSKDEQEVVKDNTKSRKKEDYER